jgi:NAD(P)H-binding
VPYRKAADVLEYSDLEYTILRPAWFSDLDEIDYEITRKGEAERGSMISKKSEATCIAKIINSPKDYIRSNIGINKPV